MESFYSDRVYMHNVQILTNQMLKYKFYLILIGFYQHHPIYIIIDLATKCAKERTNMWLFPAKSDTQQVQTQTRGVF